MARTIESKNRSEKIDMKWNLKSTRIENGVEKTIRYAKVDDSVLEEQDRESIADALVRQAERGEFSVREYRDKEGNIIPNTATGFARHVKALAANKRESSEGVRVPGGMVTDDGEPITISEELKRHARKMSGKTGFAEFTEKEGGDEGYALHDDRMDEEKDRNDSSGSGPTGFGLGSHGTPSDDMPEDRDKKLPYGGSAIGGAVKKSRFTKPDKKKKELFDDGDSELLADGITPIKEAGSGTTREEDADPIDSVVPLTHEVPRTDSLQEENKTNLLPQEPGRIDVPGNDGGGDDMVDPLGKEDKDFLFNEDGSWKDPGESQSTYDQKRVKTTPIVGMKKVVSLSGHVYIGQITKVAEQFIIVTGVRMGDTTKNNYKILRADVDKVSDYSVVPKPKIASTSLAGVYEEVSGQESTMEKTSAQFGTVEWQEEMMAKIKKKQQNGEPLNDGDYAFMQTQTEHDDRMMGGKGKTSLNSVVEANEDDDKFDAAFDKWVKKFREQGLTKDEAEEKAFEKVKHMAVNMRIADSPILKKFFGMSGKAKSMDEGNRATTEENIKGDGQLYGDDKALKDQLDAHEKKATKIKQKIANLIRSSEVFDGQGQEKEAEDCLKQAELLTMQLKNDGISVAQLKKEASSKQPRTPMFFDNPEKGKEGMFD